MDLNKSFIYYGAFISIPKCASKTILNMFELGKNRDNHLDEKKNRFIIYENHQRLKVLESRYDLNNKYIFTFVRHPYERIKSWFYYHKHINPYKSTDLNTWISNGCKTHFKVQNKTNWEKNNLSPLLQYNFIEGNTKINYIGKIENFEKDCHVISDELNEIFKKNNCKKRIKYQNLKINHTDNKNIKKDNITNENKEIIYKLFKQDFIYFNYDK